MLELWLYMLVCSNATNCPNVPIIRENGMYSEQSCRDTAPKIAIAMHYKQGGDWAWKCFKAEYKPKEIKE